VAYQGERGAFSEHAITELFPHREAIRLAQRSFADVRRAVLSGDADYGVLPVENSIHGPVAAAGAVLAEGGLAIVDRVTCPIRLCLLAMPSAQAEQLRRVLSHPVALSQCRAYLASLALLEPVAFYDTAGAAREIAARGDMTWAAVASQEAAVHYGLEIVARNIEDRADNQTRFVLVVREATRSSDSPERPAGAAMPGFSLESRARMRPRSPVEPPARAAHPDRSGPRIHRSDTPAGHLPPRRTARAGSDRRPPGT
jgi:prephenate dehydratase